MKYLGRWASGAFLAILSAELIANGGCGFGTYDDSAAPQITSANDGVADAGMWWPWVCPDGAEPSPASTPVNYTATGTCGSGGAFSVSVDGCILSGTWTTLGLSDVETTQPTSTPNFGGWIITANGTEPDGGMDIGDGGGAWTCQTSVPNSTGVLTFTCTDNTSNATTCESALIPVGGS
jgi:hypothetical protein